VENNSDSYNIQHLDRVVSRKSEREDRKMIRKEFKVYGLPGHRQRESFGKSVCYDFSEDDNIRVLELKNSDKTGTNEYSILAITRNTEEEVYAEMEGQVYDGAFENSKVGMVTEILDNGREMIMIHCVD